MLALKIIGGIFLFFFLLMFVRVGCRVDYSADGLFLWLKVLWFRFLLLPSKPMTAQQEAEKQARKKEKEKKKQAEKAAKKKAREEAKARGEQPERKKPGDLLWLLEFIRPILSALNALRRKLRVDRLKIAYAIGGAGDPAQAAIRYGQVSAGGGALFPLLNSALDVRDWDVDLHVDFMEEKTKVAFSAVASYRIGQLLSIVLVLGVKALVIYFKHKNQVKSEEEHKHGR